jgi:DNA-binding MarR family transcriptional regulator
MFFLKDLPTPDTLQAMATRFPDLEPSALTACAELLRTGSDLLAGFEKFLRGHGLSQGRFLILVVLYRDPVNGLMPTVLAEKIGVTKATMTGLLDTMEKDGLIERRPCPGDRRSHLVEIRSKAVKMLEEILPTYYKLISYTMSLLSEDECRELVDLLRKIRRNLG